MIKLYITLLAKRIILFIVLGIVTWAHISLPAVISDGMRRESVPALRILKEDSVKSFLYHSQEQSVNKPG